LRGADTDTVVGSSCLRKIMKQLSAAVKHSILTHYTSPHNRDTLSRILLLHDVSVSKRAVEKWLRRWNGTEQSLEKRARSGRPRVLSKTQVIRHVLAPIRNANRAGRVVRYTKLLPQVRAATHSSVSVQTLRRYGRKEGGAKQTRGKKRTVEELSSQQCEDIAKLRRKLQRIGTNHILFLDETHKREGDVEEYTIVLPGEPSAIESPSTSSYSSRYDMIACCSGEKVLPPIIYSPKDRENGITQHMLLEYVRNLLAQAAGALDTFPLILLVDRAGIHSEEKMLQEFHDWGCQELTHVIKIPPASAKRLSPLDNSLFNLWRHRVLESGPLSKSNIKQRMITAWESITTEDIQQQYRHCGLMRHQDPYFDCPLPQIHKHKR